MQIIIYTNIVLGIIATIFLFYKLPKLKKSKEDKEEKKWLERKPNLSIIIPARNEEHNLPNLLNDLLKQTYPIKEVVCVDDGSTDRTSDIIKEYRNREDWNLKSIEIEKLPKGWKGKTWACQNGASVARGDLLLFLDSDVRLSTTSIESLVMRYLEKKQPISIQPYHRMQKKYEYLSLFFNIIQTCATGLSVLGKRKKQGFYGPLLLIERELFNSHGGYEKVKNRPVEDFDLGKYLNSKGVSIELLLGGSEVSYRMYPKSVKDIFEGWSKNFATASFSMNWWLFAVIIVWVGFLTILPIEIIMKLVTGPTYLLYIFIGIYLYSVVLIYRVAKTIGSFPIYTCIFYPFYLLVFHLTYIYSIIGTYILKSTTWKGRKL